jgi:hypothetical protein
MEDNIKMDPKEKGCEIWTEFVCIRTGSEDEFS